MSDWLERLREVNYAKLNYILIPSTKEERERFLNSRSAKVFQWSLNVVYTFSREGRLLLLFWMLLSVVSINVSFTQYYVLWSVLTSILFASFVLRWFVDIKGLKVSVRSPSRVTRGEDVHFTLELTNTLDVPIQALRIERPFMPWDGTYKGERPKLPHLDAYGTTSLTTLASFVARGEHYIDAFTIRALTPFGMCLGKPIATEGKHFLVIPKIANVTHIQIEQTQKYQPGGVALASITGESRELVGLRPYRPGDPIRDLHAKSWARLGIPVVREYQQEYFTRIGIIIDTKGGRSDEPVFEATLSLAAGIVAQLSRGEALLDLLVIGDNVHQLTLGRSLGFLDQALDLLACVDPKKDPELMELQPRISDHMERLSSVIFISMQWEPSHEHFTSWIDSQGVRCKSLIVASKRKKDRLPPTDATIIEVEDIEAQKELVL